MEAVDPPELEPPELEPPDPEPPEPDPPELEPPELDPPELAPTKLDPPKPEPPEPPGAVPPALDPPDLAPPELDPPVLDPPEPPRADPPELDPPDLAPSELDPPVLDPPEPAPPQLAPPEIAPPELDPPEFIPVMPALELDPPELELEPPKLDAPPKLPEDPALASGLKLVSPLELLHAAKASSKEGTIRMEPKGAMDEATFMVILGVRTGEDKSCIHFGVCIRVEWVGFCFADCNACRVRLARRRQILPRVDRTRSMPHSAFAGQPVQYGHALAFRSGPGSRRRLLYPLAKRSKDPVSKKMVSS